jgi:hypothetical protein
VCVSSILDLKHPIASLSSVPVLLAVVVGEPVDDVEEEKEKGEEDEKEAVDPGKLLLLAKRQATLVGRVPDGAELNMHALGHQSF